MAPVHLSDPRFDEIVNRISESYPNSCVIYIEEVQNPVLEYAYQLRKAEIKKNRGYVNEMQLFHGTHENNIKSICESGFDPTLNVRAAFGYGVYFARDAKYSSNYMATKSRENYCFMFLCDVLVGKTGSLHKKGDTSVDNNVDQAKPTIITTVYPDGAYPRYIIAFYKSVS